MQTQYHLDATNVITKVNEAWDEFARENDAPHLVGSRVIGSSLGTHISDNSTLRLYERLLARARSGLDVIVPFRCDSPQTRRYMELHMRPAGGGGVVLTASLLREEWRPREDLLDATTARVGGHIRMCSWCKTVAVGTRWLEVEQACVELGLLNHARLPPITHGICPQCFAVWTAESD